MYICIDFFTVFFSVSYPSATHHCITHYMLIYSFMIYLYFHLTPYHVSACLFIPFLPLPLLSPHCPPPPSLSLHSMRVKATKLCLPLPPLLRLSTPHCPSQPVPRWTTERWRRSWRSASGCRWRCRGYGKKTNRSGWDAQKRKRDNLSVFSFNLSNSSIILGKAKIVVSLLNVLIIVWK